MRLEDLRWNDVLLLSFQALDTFDDDDESKAECRQKMASESIDNLDWADRPNRKQVDKEDDQDDQDDQDEDQSNN